MAASKKNSSGKQRTNKRKKSNTVQQAMSPYRDEIIMVVTLVMSILLALSTFQLGGLVGKFVSSLIFGMFGFMGYLFPYLLFFSFAFFISNQKNHSAYIKLVSSILLYIIMMGISQLVIYGYKKEFHLLDFYKASSVGKNGGGLVGGIIGNGLCYLFGLIGTYAILIGAALILTMFITERLFFAGLNKKRKQLKERRLKEREERNLYYEDEDLSLEKPKKKASIFTFSKEDKESIDSSVEGLKRKRRKNGFDRETAVSDIEELKVSDADSSELDLEHLKIMRDSEEEETKSQIPLYQEELENKFSKNKNSLELEKKIQEKEKEVFAVENRKSSPAENQEKITAGKKETEVLKNSTQTDEIKEKTEPINESSSAISSPDSKTEQKKEDYIFPSLELLSKPRGNEKGISDIELKQTAAKLKSTLESFGVRVEMKNVSCGPAVTRYELQPAQGVKVSKITSLADDIKLSLAAADIRIEAPIPGKAAVGIEVPNKENTAVMLRSLLETDDFKKHPSDIAFAVGKDIGGKTVVTDIAKMPHLLIAGATGSGKSVCINTLIMSILYKASPEDVKLIMVDPKVVELSIYNGIPHLLIPVVTDPKKASGALNWAVMEMTERYKKFADLSVRDMKGYNAKIASLGEQQDEAYQKMPQIVIIVDELADLMMVAPGEVEDAICRLAQMARAAGIHLIIATQRPSVNVITGLIKANVPSRIAFSVSSAIDSRTILDSSGAEKLLGKGDMLFFPSGIPKPIRVQGAFVSDKEVGSVVEFLASQNGGPVYNEEVNEKIVSTVSSETTVQSSNDKDEYFVEAGRFIIEKDKASIGMLQRVYKIGFNRAARIMDQLYEAGVVGPEEGTKPRKVIMTLEEFETYVSVLGQKV